MPPVRFSIALLCAVMFSLPLRAQGGAEDYIGFPAVPWGVSADSVIRILGEPEGRGTTQSGLAQLVYLRMQDSVAWGRYVLVHPSLGAVVIGYGASLQLEVKCHAAALTIVDTVVRAYPRLVWEAGDRPRPEEICAPGVEDQFGGTDPESGAHISVGLSERRTILTAEAMSAAGLTWLDSLNPSP